MVADSEPRAISFWQYQIHQEKYSGPTSSPYINWETFALRSTFQHAMVRNLNDKNAQLQKQLDNVVREGWLSTSWRSATGRRYLIISVANGELHLLNTKKEGAKLNCALVLLLKITRSRVNPRIFYRIGTWPGARAQESSRAARRLSRKRQGVCKTESKQNYPGRRQIKLTLWIIHEGTFWQAEKKGTFRTRKRQWQRGGRKPPSARPVPRWSPAQSQKQPRESSNE